MSRSRIVLASLLLIVIVGGFVAYRYSSSTAAARTGWTKYFFPPLANYSCTLATRPNISTVLGDIITATGHLTDTVLAVRSTSASTVYSLRSHSYATSTQTNPPEGATGTAPISQDFVLRYQVSSNGTLLAPEQSIHQDGIDFNVSGFVIYPPVASLKNGASRTSMLQVSFSSPNPAYASQLAATTTDHSSTVRYTIVFRVVGEPGKRIVTPGATFTDDVGVKESLLEVTPVNVKLGNALRKVLELVLKTSWPTTTLYWARGVGLVEATSQDSLGGQLLLDHCTRPRSAAS